MKSILTISFFFLTLVGYSQTVTWDGSAGDGKWHNPLNWDTDQLPCNTCTAIISNATVSISASDTIGQLILESGTLFTVNATATLSVFGGVLSVNNSLVTNYGQILSRDYSINGISVTYNGVFNNYNSIQILGSTTSPNEEGISLSDGSFFNRIGSNLIISGQGGYGVYMDNASSFDNSGEISLGYCDGGGIVNYGSFDNFSSGLIQMSFIRDRGIYNDDEFNNYGVLNILDMVPSLSGDKNGIGLINEGVFTNSLGAILRITNSIGFGINSFQDITNGGLIALKGNFINDINESLALKMSGNLINTGSIEISEIDLEGVLVTAVSVGITNSGLINIKNVGSKGIRSYSKISNSGEITVDSSGTNGIHLYDTLSNSGSVNVFHSAFESVIVDRAFLENLSDGFIHVNHSGFSGLTLIRSADFQNSGFLRIDTSATYGIYIYATSELKLSPDANIIINFAAHGGIRNLGSFHNNDGSVTISNLAPGVSFCDGFNNGGTLYNNGLLNISDTPRYGIHNSSGSGNIENYYKIQISNASEEGVYYSFGTMTNNGTLTIENCSSGLTVKQNLLFENNGTLEVMNCPGILIDNYGSIINSKNIFLSQTSSFGLRNRSYFGSLLTNKTSAKLTINAQIKNEGDITNDGLLIQDFTGVNDLLSPLNNIGVFVDIKDIQSPSVNFINSGLLLKPLKGKVSSGIKEMNLVQRTGVTTFLPQNTWYINPQITVTGGTFSSLDNSFLPNANSPYADTLYFNVVNNSIIRSVKLPIIKIPTCSSNPTATFTQAVSTDWHIAENWDTGIVPDYCTVAIIPNTKKSVITTGRKARAYRILSDTGSVFDAELGVVLEVEN